ncbi:MAG: hypothetical protein CMJ78_06195 [Planctomycetaceae bacterium]|nr:hypothetical protein [Planctomycetaceae bacterium]
MRVAALVAFQCVIFLAGSSELFAQLEFDNAPISYSSSAANDPVNRLQGKIDQGKVQLQHTSDRGYLESVLDSFGVSQASQLLVFSKTSLQFRRISPRTPRALYFNDHVYVGWIPGSDTLEISAVDPQLGATFYTLSQYESKKPRFVRDQGNCLSCHASGRTHGVPGHLVRSVYPDSNGLPHFGLGTFRTSHSSPLKKRWGGWFVTGTHGKQRHMGNAINADRDRVSLDMEGGANVTDLSKLTRVERYLTPHSDIVALMVLDHQTDMHNYIAYANYQTRIALHHGAIINRALDRPEDYISESTLRRIYNAVEKLVKCLLFVDETKLTDPVKGTSTFQTEFAKRGPFDKQERSLRQFDLKRRLFRYPCSFLIYSEAFQSLPVAAKKRVYRRVWEVVSGEDQSEAFSHLSEQDRDAIREILLSTIPSLADARSGNSE